MRNQSSRKGEKMSQRSGMLARMNLHPLLANAQAHKLLRFYFRSSPGSKLSKVLFSLRVSKVSKNHSPPWPNETTHYSGSKPSSPIEKKPEPSHSSSLTLTQSVIGEASGKTPWWK